MATKQEAEQFIKTIAPVIQKYANMYGYKVASPIIAQACIESAYGQSMLAYKYFNYFGMKCGSKWTGNSVNLKTKEEYIVGVLTSVSDNFRVYDSMKDGVEGYFEFISANRYANLFTATTAEQYLTLIKQDGYATSYRYVDNNMKIITDYDLSVYDNFSSISNAETSKAKISIEFSTGKYVISASSLRVRTGAGTNFKQKTYNELTANGKKHANSNGCLLKGTHVTVKSIVNTGNEVWGVIPSGYIALLINNVCYVNKVATTIKQYSLAKDGETQLSKNFKVKEFHCKDESDTILIDLKLVEYLQKIRDHFNKPVIINSAYRTATYNTEVGGATKSKHLYGRAADISIDGVEKNIIAAYAEFIGMLGIGLYDSFVHVDTRTTKSLWYSAKQIKVGTFL